jgi:hypothetical protein
LNNGLLDQAFDDVWNAKQTLTAAIGFVDSHSSHGFGRGQCSKRSEARLRAEESRGVPC